MNFGPLEEQQAVLTTEPSFLPPSRVSVTAKASLGSLSGQGAISRELSCKPVCLSEALLSSKAEAHRGLTVLCLTYCGEVCFGVGCFLA